MKLHSYSLAESIDLSPIAAATMHETVTVLDREIYVRLGKNSCYSIYSFGAVVFFNVAEAEQQQVLQNARAHASGVHEKPLFEDHDLKIKAGKPSAIPSEITVPKASDDVLRVVMQNLAYSVTLDYFQQVAAALLESVKSRAAEIAATGKIRLREKQLNQFIGRVMTVKNRIAEHFYIFQTLDEVWENDLLGRVHNGMVHTLELKVRFEEVEGSFRIIEENLHMMNELHVNAQSHRIEIVITVLILIEVLDLIGDKFKLFH